MKPEIIIPEGLSKKERKKFVRDFYKQELPKLIQRQKIKKIILWSTAILALSIIIYFFVRAASRPLPGQSVADLGNKHIQNITDPHEPYNSLPPTSGPHLNELAPWGVSQEAIPDELQTHNLEDGGVMLQYNCTPEKEPKEATPSANSKECQELIEKLSQIVKKYKDKVILAPYPKLDKIIALTAWTRIDKFNSFDADRIKNFIDTFRGIDHHKP